LSEIEINAIVIEKQGEDKDVTKNCWWSFLAEKAAQGHILKVRQPYFS
jgi:hypothetical protein